MHGDLSIAPQPAVRDLAARAGGTHAPTPGPSLREAGGVTLAAPAPEPEPAPDAGPPVEVARLRTLLTDPAMRVSTHHDEASGRTVLQVQSRASGELVEQIPSEALLRLYAAMRESLVDERA